MEHSGEADMLVSNHGLDAALLCGLQQEEIMPLVFCFSPLSHTRTPMLYILNFFNAKSGFNSSLEFRHHTIQGVTTSSSLPCSTTMPVLAEHAAQLLSRELSTWISTLLFHVFILLSKA